MMWPIPSLNHKLVTILFSSDAVTCCWIEKSNTSSAALTMRAYQRYPLDNLESIQLMLFNPTFIKKCVNTFLHKHSLHNSFIVFCLDDVAERYVALPTSTPHSADFGMPKTQTMLWEYRYLYSDHDGHYIFYLYAVPRSLILQYELLAISVSCNLIGITTKTAALLSSYKNIFGSAFRKSQLAIDMMRYDNDIEKLITNDAVRRMVSFTGDIPPEHYDSIAATCGIFYEFLE